MLLVEFRKDGTVKVDIVPSKPRKEVKMATRIFVECQKCGCDYEVFCSETKPSCPECGAPHWEEDDTREEDWRLPQER